MPISEAMQAALNQHIEQEFASAYLYLAMAAHCTSANLPGFAHWLRLQSLEETGHALRLFDLLTDRGGQVRLQPIPAPPATFASPLALMQQALAHEQQVSRLIHDLYAVAAQEKADTSETELQWFLAEQVEEEKTVGEIVGQLELVGRKGRRCSCSTASWPNARRKSRQRQPRPPTETERALVAVPANRGWGSAGMTQTDKVLVVIALVLGLLDVVNVRGPVSKISVAGLAIVLLALVELRRGGVLAF